MRLAILALCLCAVACGADRTAIEQPEQRGEPMEQGRRLLPSAMIHYTSDSFAADDTVRIRWSGLVVEVTHEYILACDAQNIDTGEPINPCPIEWDRVIPGQAWFTTQSAPIERPER